MWPNDFLLTLTKLQRYRCNGRQTNELALNQATHMSAKIIANQRGYRWAPECWWLKRALTWTSVVSRVMARRRDIVGIVVFPKSQNDNNKK